MQLVLQHCCRAMLRGLGADHLTFEGVGVWVSSEKNILQTDFEGKILH